MIIGDFISYLLFSINCLYAIHQVMTRYYRIGIMGLWLLAYSWQVQAQTLPRFMIDRRQDMAYMDSLSSLAKQQYQTTSRMPRTAQTDTLRLQALYYLGRLYNWWTSRGDSIRYFADELTKQARERQNLVFEVKGILLNEAYYRTQKNNYPEALSLNYKARAILQKARQDPFLGWRIELNLGELYTLAGDYENALNALNKAQALIAKGSGMSPDVTAMYQADMEEKIGDIYARQANVDEGAKHYLMAEKILAGKGSQTNFGYVYVALSQLYLKAGDYEKALIYAKKAEPIWESLNNPITVSVNWSVMALCYAQSKQNTLAISYAQKVMNFKNATLMARQRTHLALQKVYENQQDWGRSLTHYKKYIALQDTVNQETRVQELAAVQKRTELDRLTLENQQQRQLQTERLATFQKQAELDRLRSQSKADALAQRALLADQQRLLDKERTQTTLTRLRDRQKLQQQTYEQRAQLQQQTFEQETKLQERTRQWLVGGLLGVLLFTLALALVYRQNQHQKKQIEQLNAGLEQTVQLRTAQLQQANDELRQKNRAIEEALLRGQTQERRRVASELHDTLGGTLATTKLMLQRLDHADLNPDEQQIYHQLVSMMTGAGQQLRQLSHNLLPDQLLRDGLIPALNTLVSKLNLTDSVQFVLQVDENLPLLDKQTEFNLYAICLELCHNTLKHANATTASIELQRQGDRLQLLVSDNGQGIRPGQATQGSGMKNLSERAQAIGASLKVYAPEEGGTLVRLVVPVFSSSPAHSSEQT
jgi:signal transduction histidine kinase